MANEKETLEPLGWSLSRWSRRHFLSSLGWGSVALSLGGIATGSAAFLQPQMNYEATSTVTVGRPQDYRVGQMRVLESQRVLIFRTPLGFQALSMTCTHLGCAYKPFGPSDQEYREVPMHTVPATARSSPATGESLGAQRYDPWPFMP